MCKIKEIFFSNILFFLNRQIPFLLRQRNGYFTWFGDLTDIDVDQKHNWYKILQQKWEDKQSVQ
jgi:hypothetical protein